MKERPLPLGVDLGAARVRVAALSLRADGVLRLHGVGAAEAGEDLARALGAALTALGNRERRCTMAIRSSEAPLRSLRLPKMTAAERRCAARFEARAMVGGAQGRLITRSLALADGRTLIAVSPVERVRSLVAIARAAGLHPVAVAHESLVHLRAQEDAVLDVGFERSTLHAWAGPAPVTRTLPAGGESFTGALAHAYATSRATAEERKKTVGTTGAAREALVEFAGTIDRVLGELRTVEGARLDRLTLCGNGARLQGLREALERSCGIPVANVAIPGTLETGIPSDVERASVLDWFTAVAIAAHGSHVRAC